MHETYREIQNLGVLDSIMGNLNKNRKIWSKPPNLTVCGEKE